MKSLFSKQQCSYLVDIMIREGGWRGAYFGGTATVDAETGEGINVLHDLRI
jgi:hypothetical protein